MNITSTKWGEENMLTFTETKTPVGPYDIFFPITCTTRKLLHSVKQQILRLRARPRLNDSNPANFLHITVIFANRHKS